MKRVPAKHTSATDISHQSAAELRATVAALQAQLQQQNDTLQAQASALQQRDIRIELLEEMLRLKRVQQFAARSEKSQHQITLFDEAETTVEIETLHEQLPEADTPSQTVRPQRKRRQRGFSESLPRERIELPLPDADKAGASKVFFAKIKEELHYIPAQLKVLEYWQEKAVFERPSGEDEIKTAPRPVHPLGKCQATPSLLAQVITGKYADGLPLYRQQQRFKRLGHALDRGTMAHWIVRLGPVLTPLLEQIRQSQIQSDYLQADETRIQVLKENGKTAQSDKWMWVVRGGPPNQPSVLLTYDPSRSGDVPVRLLTGFSGILQADGYAGYAQVCRKNDITRIGCWDHARRKFVEASKAAPKHKGKAHKPAKADVALSHINKLYAIERRIADESASERYRVRQSESVPRLQQFKTWLEQNLGKVMKGSLTRKAMEYTLAQWESLVGYCRRGDLQISNARAENAIRPFAVGRRNWLFADTTRGAHASAACYSLIETAKANQLEPAAYIDYVLNRIGEAKTPEQITALLPWNVPLERSAKKA